MNSRVNFIVEQWGDCKVCGEYKDLRVDVCFHCSSKVDGKVIPGGHLLWEIENPDNNWVVTKDKLH